MVLPARKEFFARPGMPTVWTSRAVPRGGSGAGGPWASEGRGPHAALMDVGKGTGERAPDAQSSSSSQSEVRAGVDAPCPVNGWSGTEGTPRVSL